MTFLNYCVI